MNIIHVLDDIDLQATKQVIRLKKIYNITLLHLFPAVLEHLIREYIDDIIDVIITKMPVSDITVYCNEYNIKIYNQYINCDYISISFNIRDYVRDTNQYHFTGLSISSHIAIQNDNYSQILPILQCCNEYMKLYGNNEYFNTRRLISRFHNPNEVSRASYKNNTI